LLGGRRKISSKQTSLLTIQTGMNENNNRLEGENLSEPLQVVIPAIKKNHHKKQTHSPYKINKNENIQSKLSANPIPFNTPAMKFNQPPLMPKEEDKFIDNNNTPGDKENEQMKKEKKKLDVEHYNKNNESHQSLTSMEDEIIIDENNNNRDTEKLEHLDLSHITEARIDKVKRNNKEEKEKEIRGQQDLEMNESKNGETIQKLERHIKLMENFKDYDIDELVNEIASTEVATKLAYLLDLFLKFRSSFAQKLKLTPKNKSVVTNAINKISKNKISKVYGKVEGKEAEIFLDSCASFNMITRAALEKFNNNKQPVGSVTEKIFQAYSNTTSTADIYELEITIGRITFKDLFRVVEKDDIFDILIGVDSLKKNKLNLNFIDDILYSVDKDNNLIELTKLHYDICLSSCKDSNINTEGIEVSSSELINVTVSLITNNEEIITKEARVDKIIKMVPDIIKDPVAKLFEQFKSVIADKTDDLVKPNSIRTKLNWYKEPFQLSKRPIGNQKFKLMFLKRN